MFNQNKEEEENNKKIIQSIKEGDFNTFKNIIENNEINLGTKRNLFIRLIALNNRTEFFFYIFNSKKFKEVNFSYEKNYCIRYFSEQGNIKVVNALLTFNDIDPSDFRNLAIRNAYSNKHFDIVDLLWSLEEVKESLKEDDFNLYQTLFHEKTINNIKNF